MGFGAAQRRQLRVQGLADQRVGEPVPGGWPGAGAQQPGPFGPGKDLRYRPGRHGQGRGDQTGIDVGAQHGRGGQDPPGRSRACSVIRGGTRDLVDLPPDRLPDPGRHGRLRHLLHRPGPVREQPGHLRDEQRVAFAAFLHGGEHPGGRGRQQGADLGRGQAPQGQGGTVAFQGADHLAEIGVEPDLDVPVRGDQQDPGQAPGGREPQQQRRRVTGRVQVIEHDDQRRRPAGPCPAGPAPTGAGAASPTRSGTSRSPGPAASSAPRPRPSAWQTSSTRRTRPSAASACGRKGSPLSPMYGDRRPCTYSGRRRPPTRQRSRNEGRRSHQATAASPGNQRNRHLS